MTMTTKPSISLSGRWRNQLGSLLELEGDGDGGIHGKFCNSVGSEAGRWQPLRGWYDPSAGQGSNVIGFVVDWTGLHCITAWSGQYRPGTDTISATWTMTTACEADDEWKATVVGHDVFHRDDGPEGADS